MSFSQLFASSSDRRFEINANDNSLQEKLNVVEKTLTMKEAKYIRRTLSTGRFENGRGATAKPIAEELAQNQSFPKIT